MDFGVNSGVTHAQQAGNLYVHACMVMYVSDLSKAHIKCSVGASSGCYQTSAHPDSVSNHSPCLAAPTAQPRPAAITYEHTTIRHNLWQAQMRTDVACSQA